LSNTSTYIKRKSFAKIPPVQSMPDLLAVQLESFEDFLQETVLPTERTNKGLESAFRNIFPLQD
jgi:DNA-directed RNA polymerase subunit beta